ncbi:hypothetical protein ABEO75_27360 [Paenibacillus macerans]|uniref:hypothetical protein n=1 Tax=Paenibacillus macerans TaxID=44252 RepID=UPI002E1EB822|nr:hypothetical protein [Paenibacillus macerans]
MDIELALRVLIAGICGALTGFERKNRMKEAGVKTHYVPRGRSGADDHHFEIRLSGPDRLEQLHISVPGFEAERRDEEIELELTVKFKSGANLETLLSSMNEDIKRMKVE